MAIPLWRRYARLSRDERIIQIAANRLDREEFITRPTRESGIRERFGEVGV